MKSPSTPASIPAKVITVNLTILFNGSRAVNSIPALSATGILYFKDSGFLHPNLSLNIFAHNLLVARSFAISSKKLRPTWGCPQNPGATSSGLIPTLIHSSIRDITLPSPNATSWTGLAPASAGSYPSRVVCQGLDKGQFSIINLINSVSNFIVVLGGNPIQSCPH